MKKIDFNESKTVTVSDDMVQIMKSHVKCFHKSENFEIIVTGDDQIYTMVLKYRDLTPTSTSTSKIWSELRKSINGTNVLF